MCRHSRPARRDLAGPGWRDCRVCAGSVFDIRVCEPGTASCLTAHPLILVERMFLLEQTELPGGLPRFACYSAWLLQLNGYHTCFMWSRASQHGRIVPPGLGINCRDPPCGSSSLFHVDAALVRSTTTYIAPLGCLSVEARTPASLRRSLQALLLGCCWVPLPVDREPLVGAPRSLWAKLASDLSSWDC